MQALGDDCAVTRMGDDGDLRRQAAEGLDRKRQASDHACLSRHQRRTGLCSLRDRRDRGDVAGAAEIFLERDTDGALDRQRREESLRM